MGKWKIYMYIKGFQPWSVNDIWGFLLYEAFLIRQLSEEPNGMQIMSPEPNGIVLNSVELSRVEQKMTNLIHFPPIHFQCL